jgi:hypothetical protein
MKTTLALTILATLTLTGCGGGATAKVPAATTKSDQTLAGASSKTECAELGVDCGDEVALVCCDDTSCVVGIVGDSNFAILQCSGTVGADEYCSEEIQAVVNYCGGGGGGDTGWNDTGRRR